MNLIIFDLETTGFSPRCHDIIQIAAVRLRDGQIGDETFSTYVRPQGYIPRQITELTGISNADVTAAPTAEEALRSFARFVGGAGEENGSGETTLVAHNGHRFDMRFLSETCRRHEIPTRPVRFIDSLWLSKKFWPDESLHNLDAIADRLGLATDELAHPRHDARADVRLLANAVNHMLQRLYPSAGRKIHLLSDLCRGDFEFIAA